VALRVVSYNVRYFGHWLKGLASTATAKRRIAEALAGLEPRADLIALQEVETRSMRAKVAHRGAHPSETQLEAFLRHFTDALRARGAAMSYRAWYFPAHAYRLGPLTFYTTGLAVLVNGDTLHVTADNGGRPHHVTHHRSMRLKKVKQTRIAAHLALETIKGRPFHLFNTHLSLPSPLAKEYWSQPGKMGFGKNQVEEAKALCAFVAATAKGQPRLIVGDFNSAPATPVYRTLTVDAKLTGAQEHLGQIDPSRRDAFATAGFMAMRMHLDHVFGGGRLDFLDLHGTYPFGDPQSPFHGLSDHIPLIARFEVH
jgi:endonuclease/exonuclease/phosphatase family metal-dependent hydrolase